MKKKILLIGNGAREHAIAAALKRSPQDISLVAYGKNVNPGIRDLCDVYETGSLADLEKIRLLAMRDDIHFAIVGPEDPLALGVADVLLSVGVPTVGPTRALARLESSKSFTRDLFQKYNIFGNPLFRVFESFESFESEEGDDKILKKSSGKSSAKSMEKFVEEVGGHFVVKADGLRAGKGVKVSGDHFSSSAEGLAYARECLAEDGCVVLEEKLVGQEFSLMSFCDGRHLIHMPAVQDHKRAYEDDKGPNTGGMGTYSDADHSLPFLRPEDIAEAHRMNEAVAAALLEETGVEYKGILYGGFMAVRKGVRLIEYNARFGDPESLNVLSLLETDFVEVCEALLEGSLDSLPVSFAKKATVCKYVVPKGYPESAVKGEKIKIGHRSDSSFPDRHIPRDHIVESPILNRVFMYMGSVEERDGDLLLCGSRAVGVVGIADDLASAEKLAEEAVQQISGPVFHRRDIGTDDLIAKRVAMMKKLRG